MPPGGDCRFECLDLKLLRLKYLRMLFGQALPVGALLFQPSLRALQLGDPFLLAGKLVGAALGLSGAVMQGYLRNPLADPGLFGVSAGAALGTATMLIVVALLDAPPVSINPLASFAARINSVAVSKDVGKLVVPMATG